jgi:FtsZ-binding cell division protein ZapB
LERKIRITSSTCQDLQVKYNQLLEKNVYLQQEVENKMELIVTIQRIKDELKDANIELAVLRSKLNDTNVNTNNNNVAEAMVPYQILSPNKSQTPTTTYSTVYNYDYNHQENGNNINVSGMTTPTMNDSTNEQNKIYSSDILKKNNTNNLSNELMIFTSNGTALNKKPFFMVQEFLERAKSLEMKIASARSTLAHTNELSS